MTQRKILARDIIVQVEDATPNTWFAVNGMNSTSPNPSEDAEDTNITDYNDAGRPQFLPTQRGASFGIEGFKLLDHITGAKDPGQGRCETLADALGYDGRGRIRFRFPTEPSWTVWTVTMQAGEQGGGNNDASKWALTVKRSGAATTAVVL